MSLGIGISCGNLEFPQRLKNLFGLMQGRFFQIGIRSTLRSLGVDVPLSCIFCNNAFENSWHLFLGCNFAENCWQQASLADTMNNMASNMDTYVQ